MSTISYRKFKKNVQAYMEGQRFSQWDGIKNPTEVRQNLKIIASARDKRDFTMFSYDKNMDRNLRLELIEGTKNHYSVRNGGAWRIFFIWADSQAWEIDLNHHDYQKIRR